MLEVAGAEDAERDETTFPEDDETESERFSILEDDAVDTAGAEEAEPSIADEAYELVGAEGDEPAGERSEGAAPE